MRVESTKAYGPPIQSKEPVENAPGRAGKLPERTSNKAGDQFELSAEQKVTQDLLSAPGQPAEASSLSAERLADLRGKIGTGYYLTPQAAEATAKAVADFHHPS